MAGIWSSLGHRVFALVLVANLFATLAVFMNGLSAAWVLTEITDSAAVVAGLQAATALPAFVLAMVAGALSDIVRRKTLIVVGLGGSALTSGGFAALSASGRDTAASILILTVALGVFTAIAAPAWIAAIPGLVPKAELAGAMSLSSAAASVAMAAGPAVAGVVIAFASPTAVFVLNTAVFTGGMISLLWWRPPGRQGLPPEHLRSAIRVGLQYVRFDRPLKETIAKVVPLALAGTAVPALLPVVARFRLGAGPGGFGVLAAAGGLGAIVGLVLLSPIRKRVGPDGIVLGAGLVQGAAVALLARSNSISAAFVLLTLVGVTNLAIISTAMTALQVVLPAWVRGRGVAVYLVALQGAFAIGAVVWGFAAEQFGVSAALYAAGALLAGAALAVTPLRLDAYADHDTSPIRLIDAPVASTAVHDSDGPILVTVEWEIPDDKREAFLEAMAPVGKALRRQGALDFHLVESTAIPGRIIESFSVATWAEYQRMSLRSTAADKPVHDALVEVVGRDLPPLVAHRELET